MNKKQTGFALIEGLLIILILAIIGFGGYYVWNSQKNVDKTSKDAVSASQSTPSASSTSNTSQKYLTIKEWGVRIPYMGTDTYTYKYDTSTPNLIQVVSSQLASKYDCIEIGAGLLARVLPSAPLSFPGGQSETVEQYAAENPGTYFKVGGNYYTWGHDQAACSNTVTAEAQNQASTTFQGAVKNIEATPQ